MKSLILSALICLCLYAKAQNFIENQFVFGGDFSDQPIKIIEANDNLYLLLVLGSQTSTGNLTYPPLPCGGFSTLLICFDTDGTSLWQKAFCGNRASVPTDIIDTGDGLVMCVSSTSDANTGNKTSELFTNLEFPHADYWIIKTDYDGNILWQKTYGSYQPDVPLNLSLNTNGNILLTGRSSFSGPFNTLLTGNKTVVNKGRNDAWIILIDENGDEIWQKTLGVVSPNQSLISPHQGVSLPNGNFLISATSSYFGVSGDKTVENYGNANAWLICLDENGNQLWDKVYGGQNFERNGKFILEENHVFYILESSSGVAGNRTTPTKGIQDILVYKLDFDGNIIAQTNFGDDGITELYSVYGHENRIILSLIPGSEEPSYDKSEPSRGGTDYWILSFDTETLELVNEKTYGGEENDDSRSVVFHDNHLYIAGWSASGIGGDKTIENYSSGNAWILKVNPTHLLTIDEQILINSTIFPNPASNQINISFTEPTKLNKAVLYDLSGKVVLEQDLSASFEANYVLNTQGLASGVYSLSLVGDGFVKTQQVVVQ